MKNRPSPPSTPSRDSKRVLNRLNLTPPAAGSAMRSVGLYNRWRDSFNPLRALTMTRAVSMLEQYDRGEMADLQWTFRSCERADADLLALCELRLGSILEMDWTVKLVEDDTAGFDLTLAEEQRDALFAAYNKIDNLDTAIEHLATAAFRGFAHVQINETEFIPVDQWNVVRDGSNGQWKYNEKADQVSFYSLPDSLLMPDEEFILLEAARPIDRFALPKFVRGNLGEKDWTAFLEIYGIPSGVVTMPSGIKTDEVDSWVEQAKIISEGGAGALPAGSTYTPNDQPRGTNPFRDFLTYFSEKLVLVGTGGKLTMLTESGSGTLAGGAHTDTFRTIAKAQGKRISERGFQRQFDKPYLGRLFPDQPVLAYFTLEFSAEMDTDAIVNHAAQLAAARYRIDAEELSERTGYQLTEEEAPQPPSPFGLGNSSTLSTSSPESREAKEDKDLDEQIENILRADDPQLLRNRLAALARIRNPQ